MFIFRDRMYRTDFQISAIFLDSNVAEFYIHLYSSYGRKIAKIVFKNKERQ